MHVPDEADKKLLRLLQQDNRLTAEALGIAVDLSPSAVQRRLAKLRSEKIIEADISIISAAAAGIGITCVVDVVLHEGSSKAIDQFKSKMLVCTEVAQCYYVTGSYDFVLIIHTRDMTQFESFTKQHLMDNPNLKHFYTHVVMDKVKVGYGITI